MLHYSYHGKSVLIDDNISVIGSFNIDMRSAYLDTELMLVIDSKDINRELNQSMEGYERVARKADKDGSYDNPSTITFTDTPRSEASRSAPRISIKIYNKVIRLHHGNLWEDFMISIL